MCDPEQVEPFPEGEPVWTAADVEACATACPTSDDNCVMQKCPKREEHLLCLADSLDACLTEPNGDCREEWESYLCCSLEQCDERLTNAQLEQCIENECGEQLDAYSDCSSGAAGQRSPKHECVQRAEQRCLLSSEDAGASDAGASDAGLPEAGGDAGEGG